MTDLTKNFDQLSFGDLVSVCEAKNIKVGEDDDRSALLKKLAPKPKAGKK